MGANDKLEVQAVTKAFGGVAANQAISLAVREGELVSLLGPSGCGKTTLLRIVAGLEIPDAGRVLIDGCDVTAQRPRLRRVGMVFQHYALFPHMTVFDNVAYGLRMQGTPAAQVRERVARMLAVVQLTGTEGRYPRQLSGGQQQRVAIARALVTEPAILLMDEPLGALDLKLRQQMQVEFRRIQQQVGITTVYVTHDQTEALTISDRIAVFNRGRIEQIGAAAEVYSRPATRFVAQFIGEASVLTGQVLRAERTGIGVEVGGGVRLAASASGLDVSPGSPVSLTVRPERVAVLAQGVTPPPGSNRLTGTVRQLIYLGEAFLGTAELPGGQSLRFRLPAGDQLPPAVGTPVQFAIAPDALWPVAEGDA